MQFINTLSNCGQTVHKTKLSSSSGLDSIKIILTVLNTTCTQTCTNIDSLKSQLSERIKDHKVKINTSSTSLIIINCIKTIKVKSH